MKLTLSGGALLVSSLCIGCASTSQRPVNELATARASITLAEQSGAQQHSAASLNKARQKAQRAADLSTEGEYETAQRFANEAEVDARVATAESALKKSRQSAEELDSTLKTLESELNRGQ